MANVLIVEDSKSIAMAQAYRVWESGHTVSFANNGQEALAHCQSEEFDVILLDYDLPDITGLEVYRSLRKMNLQSAVVMITGKGDERLAAQIIKEGAKDYLTKSDKLLDILPGVINRVLQERDVQRLLEAKDLELKRAYSELEKKVGERTVELARSNQWLEQEVSYRKRVEGALYESNHLLLTIMDSISDGFVSMDLQFNVSYVNRAAKELLQPQSDEILGRNFFEVFPWAGFLELKTRLGDAMENHRQAALEIRVDAPPPWNWLDLRIYPRQENITVQFQSAAQRKEIEDRNSRQQQLLETMVAKRTAELAGANQKLRREIDERIRAEQTLMQTNTAMKKIMADLKFSQAQVLQSEKMACVGQLAAGVAHEINNPTGFVSSNLYSLAAYCKDINRLLEACMALRVHLQHEDAGALSESVQRQCAVLADLERELNPADMMADIEAIIHESREGTERIKRIVGDLKNFAHPGNNRLEEVDLNANIEATINLAWHEIKYKAEVCRQFGELPPVRCYPQLLNQVFLNLLVNAAQAMGTKGVITIRTWIEDDGVCICIQDTGAGIAPEHLPKIFDPFFTTKKVGQGTGLGLKVVYDIIQTHGGRIDVSSTIGVGTAFTIRLPSAIPQCIGAGIPEDL